MALLSFSDILRLRTEMLLTYETEREDTGDNGSNSVGTVPCGDSTPVSIMLLWVGLDARATTYRIGCSDRLYH